MQDCAVAMHARHVLPWAGLGLADRVRVRTVNTNSVKKAYTTVAS